MTRSGWPPAHQPDPESWPTTTDIGKLYDDALRAMSSGAPHVPADLAREHHFTLVAAPRGLHAWLCRLGIHAWELRRRWISADGHSGENQRRCAVCRRWETR